MTIEPLNEKLFLRIARSNSKVPRLLLYQPTSRPASRGHQPTRTPRRPIPCRVSFHHQGEGMTMKKKASPGRSSTVRAKRIIRLDLITTVELILMVIFTIASFTRDFARASAMTQTLAVGGEHACVITIEGAVKVRYLEQPSTNESRDLPPRSSRPCS